MAGVSRALRTGVALGIGLLVVVAGWFLVDYSLGRALTRANFEPLETMAKAVASDIIVIRQKGKEAPRRSEGILEAYQRNPEKVQADAKLSQAWFAASSLADAVFKNGPNGNWVQRADEMATAGTGNRTDPWGHPFCVLRRDDVVVILSAGPAAQATPTCKNVPLEASELARLPRWRMIETPRGTLLLAAEGKPQGPKLGPND